MKNKYRYKIFRKGHYHTCLLNECNSKQEAIDYGYKHYKKMDSKLTEEDIEVTLSAVLNEVGEWKTV